MIRPLRKIADVMDNVDERTERMEHAFTDALRNLPVDDVARDARQSMAMMRGAVDVVLDEVRDAAQAHRRVMETVDAILWAGVAALAIYYVVDLGRSVAGKYFG
jgi:hypothetical protein